MIKVLVTGAAGFVGSNLSERLLKEGYFIFGIDNVITGTNENIERLKKYRNFEFIKGDIVNLDGTSLAKLTARRFDQVYHLACPTGVPNLVTLSEEMLLACSIGTRNILEIARNSKAKFILSSSSEVYGDPLVFPQREDYTGNVDITGIRSPYEEGKRFAESLTVMYVRRYNLDGKIVRIFNTYGPNMNPKDERVVPKFLQQIKEGRPLSVHGEGKQRRTYLHVDDLVDGLTLVMEKGEKGQVYNIGSSEEIQVMELAKLMLELSGTSGAIHNIEGLPHDHKARLPDITKIASLGWSPKIILRRGLSKIFAEELQPQRG